MGAFRQDFQPPFLVHHRPSAGQQAKPFFGEQTIQDSSAQGNPQAVGGKNSTEV